MNLVIVNKSLSEFFPCKNINSHGSKITLRICRLFLKLINFVIVKSIHYAKSSGFFKRHFQYGYRRRTVVFLMEFQHFRIVHFINMVAGKYKHIFGIISVYVVQIVINGIGCSHKPIAHFLSAFYMGREHCNPSVLSVQVPRYTYSYMMVKHKRLVLGKHTYSIDT